MKPLKGLASARNIIMAALVAAATPAPAISVSDWASEKREVSAESGSPHPGKWDNAVAPYLVEIMDCLSLEHPCRSVVLKKSHQIGGSEAGLNFFGYAVDHHPAPFMIVLPTLDEAQKYNRIKLQPAIDGTDALRGRVREQKSRDSSGSTGSFKRYPGGFAVITGANSSAGLQMISARYQIFEEVSEYPDDVGGRGDPLSLAEKRSTAWSEVGYKRFYVSTPGLAGMCRISDLFEASDQRRLFLPCPHCGDTITLLFENLRPANDDWPYGCVYSCQSCGADIAHHHKRDMLAGGVWIPTFEDADAGFAKTDVIDAADIDRWRTRAREGREPGFHVNQLYSPFVSWDDTWHTWKQAEGNPHLEKVFSQQVLGLEWNEEGDAPDWEKLLMRREDYSLGRMPPGALVLTGMADVQGDRLEWGVYGWGIGMTGWLVDKGIIEGDPGRAEVWRALADVTERLYEDWQGHQWPIEAFGVDAGYLSHMVYQFCRTRQRVFALDGRAGHLHPLIGTPRKQDVNVAGKRIKGGVWLWPTGTWPLKSWVYSSLRKTLEGPDADGRWPLGSLHFPDACDETFFKQLTAEYLAKVQKRDRTVLEWRQVRGQANEQLDIAVGALAMAAHLGLDRYTPARWADVAADRGAPPEQAQRDMAALWTGANKPPGADAAPGSASPAAAQAARAVRHKAPKPRRSVSSLMGR